MNGREVSAWTEGGWGRGRGGGEGEGGSGGGETAGDSYRGGRSARTDGGWGRGKGRGGGEGGEGKAGDHDPGRRKSSATMVEVEVEDDSKDTVPAPARELRVPIVPDSSAIRGRSAMDD
jgi:hypothetical protein